MSLGHRLGHPSGIFYAHTYTAITAAISISYRLFGDTHDGFSERDMAAVSLSENNINKC